MSPISLSVVILEYHSLPDLGKCIKSLSDNLCDLTFEIVVSSNSCYEESQQNKLIEEYPNVKWIFNSQNLGFAGGVNRGLNSASAPYILHINVDGEIVQGTQEAIGLMQEDRRIGIIGPKIVDNDGVLQDSFRKFLSPFNLIYRTLYRILYRENFPLFDYKEFEKANEVDWVIGGAFLISKESLEDVGGLDESYFLYVEDMDWSMRYWQKGYKVVWQPEWIVRYQGDRKSVSALSKGVKASKYSMYHIRSYFRFLFKFRFSWKRPG